MAKLSNRAFSSSHRIRPYWSNAVVGFACDAAREPLTHERTKQISSSCRRTLKPVVEGYKRGIRKQANKALNEQCPGWTEQREDLCIQHAYDYGPHSIPPGH